MRLVAFCEAPGDFRLASGLVDRVLRESAIPWIVDNFERPEVIRTWQRDRFGNEYFDIHRLNQYSADQRGARIRGHFDGQPGRPGGAMARKAFLIARALHKEVAGEPIDAVVLLWDTDQQPSERIEGVEAAREEARRWAPFQIVCGFPDPEREAWVLAGFDPCDDAEQQRLSDLQRVLGFSPVLEAVRLRDRAGGSLRNIKRVLAVLTTGDPEREARCWTDPPLATLRQRGVGTGLSAFLEQLHAEVLAVLHPRTRVR